MSLIIFLNYHLLRPDLWEPAEPPPLHAVFAVAVCSGQSRWGTLLLALWNQELGGKENEVKETRQKAAPVGIHQTDYSQRMTKEKFHLLETPPPKTRGECAQQKAKDKF